MPMPTPGTACRAVMKGPVGTEDSSAPAGNVDKDRGSGHGLDSGDRLADLAPAGKVPFVGESFALRRFHRMDAAGVAVQHDALVTLLFDQ